MTVTGALRYAALLSALVFTSVLLAPRVASPRDGAAGLAQRGPGAQERARLARAVSTESIDGLDDLLTEYARRRDDPMEILDGASIDALATDALAGRNALAARVAALPSGTRGAFLANVIPGAAFADWRWGVPASVTVAQAILESGWGSSAPGFNLFGMKGEGPAGSNARRVVEYRGGKRRRATQAFRAYSSFAESLADHARVLATSRRYAKARAAADDPAAYARALTGVYATDPRYAKKLCDIVDRYALDRFDVPDAVPLARSTAGP